MRTAGLARSSFYLEPAGESAENLELLRLMDEQYLEKPFPGSGRMALWLREQGREVNCKRVRRLMGLEAIYPTLETAQRVVLVTGLVKLDEGSGRLLRVALEDRGDVFGHVLDDAADLAPTYHAFFSDKAQWMDVPDSLPKRGGESGVEPLDE